MMERCESMVRQKLKAKEKKTQKITKDGLVEKSQETGKQINISNKVSDFSLDKKQSKKQKRMKQRKKYGIFDAETNQLPASNFFLMNPKYVHLQRWQVCS